MVFTTKLNTVYLKQLTTFCFLSLALIIIACSTTNPPYQTLYEAKTAINAAQNKIGPCPCEALIPAEQSYERAIQLNKNKQYNEAELVANQALTQAQNVLRQYR